MYKDRLVTRCNNVTYYLDYLKPDGNLFCSQYNISNGKSYKDVLPKGLLYCADNNGKPITSPLTNYLLQRGQITPDIQSHCALSTLGIAKDSDHLEFYCHPSSGSATENTKWIKTVLSAASPIEHNHQLYVYNSDGKVTIPQWSATCGAYIYETTTTPDMQSVHCAFWDKKNNSLKLTPSPDARSWEKSDYLDSSVEALCDLSYLGNLHKALGTSQDNANNAPFPEPVFYCQSLSNGQPSGSWVSTDLSVSPVWPKPSNYETFVVDKAGQVSIGNTPAPGTYMQQCTIYNAAFGNLGNAYPQTISATCGDAKTFNDSWNYATTCTPGSNVFADDTGKLQCQIEAGAPNITGACTLVSYHSGEAYIVCPTYNPSSSATYAFDDVTMTKEQYGKFQENCDINYGVRINEGGAQECIAQKDAGAPPALPDGCSMTNFTNDGQLTAICDGQVSNLDYSSCQYKPHLLVDDGKLVCSARFAPYNGNNSCLVDWSTGLIWASSSKLQLGNATQQDGLELRVDR